jgi:hypothetical protein
MADNPAPLVNQNADHPRTIQELHDDELVAIREELYDIVHDIKDPEHPYTLEQLRVVQEDCIHLQRLASGHLHVKVSSSFSI